MLIEVAIIGGGPAGLSAALTAKQRNKEVVIFEARGFSPKLSKAHMVENYLGMPAVTGKQMMDNFVAHVKKHDPIIIEEKVLSIFHNNDTFSITTTKTTYQAMSVIFAIGAPVGKVLPGETEFLGRGVSYCATCDGMFFKDKKIAVIAGLPESEEETNFLAELCSEIIYIPLYKGEHPKKDNIKILQEIPKEIIGDGLVSGLQTDKALHEVSGVFIFRDSEPVNNIMSTLELEDNFVKVDAEMKTNIKGLFAAGDCTGRPMQISRATGQGLTATLSAVTHLAQFKS